jgi:hypothetical protein
VRHEVEELAVEPVDKAELGLEEPRPLSAIMSNTGWTSFGERLMTLSTSAVATCCSRASFSSRASRAAFVSLLAAPVLRRRTPFGALRCVNFMRRCGLTALPPVLSRRLIASLET